MTYVTDEDLCNIATNSMFCKLELASQQISPNLLIHISMADFRDKRLLPLYNEMPLEVLGRPSYQLIPSRYHSLDIIGNSWVYQSF